MLVVGLALAGALAQSARAAELGFVPDLNWGTSAADQDRTGAVLKDAGSQWVRLHVQWRDWEPNGASATLPSTGILTSTDRAVQIAHANGSKVLIMVYNAPAWASDSKSTEGAVPRNASDYANFMSHLAAHYKGQVDAYEIWNEMDIDRFWAGGEDPVKYTSLLKASYPAIKAADPNAKVVFGGLSWDWKKTGNFLARSYDAGAKGSFDVMAIHPYPDSTTDPTLTNWRTWMPMAHDWMTKYGDGDKPIWFTEFGVNTSTATSGSQPGVSEAAQATLLTTAFTLLKDMPYVTAVFYYNLRNNYWSHDDPTSIEANFGLLHTDWSPKPAYAVFQSFAKATAPVPPPVTPIAPPTGLSASGATQTSVSLAWTASVDSRTSVYSIARGGSAIGTTAGTGFVAGSLACGTSYTFSVAAVSVAGVVSTPATVTASTAACTVPPPPLPPPPPPPPPVPPTPPANLPPTITITTPVAGSHFWQSLKITATASDDKGVTKVEFYVDGKLVQTDTAAPYSFWWGGAKKAGVGTHTITAVAYDAAGATTTATVTVVKSRSTLFSAKRTLAASRASSVARHFRWR